MTIKIKITHAGAAGDILVRSSTIDFTPAGNRHVMPAPLPAVLATITPEGTYETEVHGGHTLVLSTVFDSALTPFKVTNEGTSGNIVLVSRASAALAVRHAIGEDVTNEKVIASVTVAPGVTVGDHIWPGNDQMVGALSATPAPSVAAAPVPPAPVPPAPVAPEPVAHGAFSEPQPPAAAEHGEVVE